MKCPLCSRRKGKRFCPAKNTSICAQCCGEKRVVEIRCPVDCQYLTFGQSFKAGKEVVQQLSEITDQELRSKIVTIRFQFPGLLHKLEGSLVQSTQELSSIDDQDVAESVKLVLERYQLEQKGLIYQDKSPKPLVESLARELAETVEKERHRNRSEESESLEVPLELLVTALEVIVADVEYHSKKAEGSRDYLEFTRRNHPEIETKKPSNLIIPG